MVDDTEVDANEIEGLDDPKVADVSQGGLDNKVIIRTYAIESIEKMRVMGEKIA